MIVSVKFSFREAKKKDEKLLLDWRNDSCVRKWSFRKKPISFSEHKKFFKEKIYDKNYHMWIFQKNSIPCGLVRINIKDKKAVINYYIDKKYRGRKLSIIMLTMMRNEFCKKYSKVKIYAYTLSKNIISTKSLLKAGFELESIKDKKRIYVYKCS